MYQYILFEKDWTGLLGAEEIAEASPGKIVGIYFRLYLDGNFYKHPFLDISVADIGAAKDYLMKEAPVGAFMVGNPIGGIAFQGWYDEVFVPLQHILEKDHLLVLEGKVWSGPDGVAVIKIKGNFIYEK